jgi:transcriptional regulator with XRE-family HTH domain
MKPNPTMQEVADRAQVSRMTVSRALRNDPKISLATRERVQQIARDMGYRTNALVSALMSNLRQTRAPSDVTTLAFLTSMPSRSGWREIAAFSPLFHRRQGKGRATRLPPGGVLAPRKRTDGRRSRPGPAHPQHSRNHDRADGRPSHRHRFAVAGICLCRFRLLDGRPPGLSRHQPPAPLDPDGSNTPSVGTSAPGEAPRPTPT